MSEWYPKGATEGAWEWARTTASIDDPHEVARLDKRAGDTAISAPSRDVMQSWDHEGYLSGVRIRAADAELILQAVNQYGPLLEALSALADTAEQLAEQQEMGYPWWLDSVEDARALLDQCRKWKEEQDR